jgi:hypothetical protein
MNPLRDLYNVFKQDIQQQGEYCHATQTLQLSAARGTGRGQAGPWSSCWGMVVQGDSCSTHPTLASFASCPRSAHAAYQRGDCN